MTRMILIKNDPQENNLNVFTPPYFSYITLPTKPFPGTSLKLILQINT